METSSTDEMARHAEALKNSSSKMIRKILKFIFFVANLAAMTKIYFPHLTTEGIILSVTGQKQNIIKAGHVTKPLS